jgi:DUF971 family protein
MTTGGLAACRCAGCRSQVWRGPWQQPPPDVHLAAAEPVGQYGLNLRFSDGHGRGIYPWALLRELALSRAAGAWPG